MAISNPAARYLISRYGDPAFALSIGLSAAILRIRNEETEKRSGFPSSAMVISPVQQKRRDIEHEEKRSRQSDSSKMYSAGDHGSSETLGSHDSGKNSRIVEIGYTEILRLAWDRIKWKADYEWNGRGKELQRKD